MVAGQQNKKIAFVIQARMKSTRLPGKILLPLPIIDGKPLLKWIIDELKKSAHKADIFLATSTNQENDVLVPFCESSKISCFRGDEENVLSRFTAIIKLGNYDCAVRLTGDNPLIDVEIFDQTINVHFEQQNDYTKTEGLPVGMNVEVITGKTLLDLENQRLAVSDEEHVTMFIRNSGKYKLGIYRPIAEPKFEKLRLTVDYASDYALMNILLAQKDLKGMKLVEHMYKKYSWLFDVNNSNFQKKIYYDENEELSEAEKFLLQFDFIHAAQIIAKHIKHRNISA